MWYVRMNEKYSHLYFPPVCPRFSISSLTHNKYVDSEKAVANFKDTVTGMVFSVMPAINNIMLKPKL